MISILPLSTASAKQKREDIQHSPETWPAYLRLNIAGGEYGSRIMRRQHKGPLYVQKAFYPEGKDTAHIYLLHPPGGIVSGDTLDLAITLENKAHALVTTPGASRFYRARIEANGGPSLPQKVCNTLAVKGQSCIEWLPHETIVYNGADLSVTTRISLDAKAKLIAWEISCLGLPVANKLFEQGRYRQRFEVSVAGETRIIENLAFDATAPLTTSLSGFQSKPVIGTMIAGPHFRSQSDTLIQALRIHLKSPEKQGLFAATLYNGFIVLRYLGGCADQAKKLFTQAWEWLRPQLLDKPAVHPRIWST